MKHLDLGRQGEDRAVALLVRRGYTILARNYRARQGEIDVVALESGEVVFVEVKTRTGEGHGSGLEAVTDAKKRRIARTAEQFLLERGLSERPCRFDVVAIDVSDGGEDVIVQAAFSL